MSAKQHKILIVDDDHDIVELLKYNLEKEGYLIQTEVNSVSTIETASKFKPDLIILDIMMPQINGIEICRQLRQMPGFQHTYIFFLTAKSERNLQLMALDTGGDDFIEKITGIRSLTHKIKTVLKNSLVIRKGMREIKLGELELDRVTYAVNYRGRKIELPKYEFEMLYFFAQNPKKIITQDSLLHNIWGSDVYLFAKSVDTYVANLSNKIGVPLISKIKGDKYKLVIS